MGFGCNRDAGLVLPRVCHVVGCEFRPTPPIRATCHRAQHASVAHTHTWRSLNDHRDRFVTAEMGVPNIPWDTVPGCGRGWTRAELPYEASLRNLPNYDLGVNC